MSERERLAGAPTTEPDDLELAFRTGAIAALRSRAGRQAAVAARGTSTAEGRPDVLIRTGEAAIAARLAEVFAAVADELESELIAASSAIGEAGHA
jgi:hypothetical protein